LGKDLPGNNEKIYFSFATSGGKDYEEELAIVGHLLSGPSLNYQIHQNVLVCEEGQMGTTVIKERG